MKILSVINQSIKNTPTFKPYIAQSPQTSLQYAYNPPCDTVSFSGRLKEAEMQEDDWLEDRDINSDAIIKHLDMNNYEQALKLIESIKEQDWEPNSYVLDKENGDNCLMTLTIDKMKDYSPNSEDYKDLQRIAKHIASHKDFECINRSTGQDTLYEAILADVPEIAMAIIVSKDFQNDLGTEFLGTEELQQYMELAHAQNMDEVENKLKSLSTCVSQTTSKAYDDVINVEQLKSKLNKYELNQNPNDPKSLDEVGGMFQAKKDIEEFIIKPWHKDFRDKILENRLNRPSGFLLSGPPGCGKTYIMKAIAAQTGYSLYEINLANIGNSAAYKTQTDLKNLFNDLEELYKLTGEPSIVLLDELDSIAMDRKNCQTDWKKDDINALLMAINNSAQRGIIVVGATNDYNALDSAVKRSGRLDKHIEIGLPDYEEAKDIADKILTDRPIGAELYSNLDTLAQKLKGLPPATISSILHNACLNAIYEYKDVATMDDFEKMYDSLKHNSEVSGRVRIKGFSADN